MTKRSLMTTLAALLISGSMAAPAPAAPVVTYFTDRVHDFLDIFRVRAGFPDGGKGIGVKARATVLAQAGYVYFDGTYAGLERRGIGIVDERRHEGGVSFIYLSRNEMEPTWGNMFLKGGEEWHEVRDRRILRNLPHWDDGRRRPLSFGAEVVTPILALDLGVYPEEAFDFVLGIFTIDIFKDDQLRNYRVPYREGEALPLPFKDAPFAPKRQQFEELQLKLLIAEMEELGQVEDWEDYDYGVYPDVTPEPAAPPPFDPLIEDTEANAAIQELDALDAEVREMEELEAEPAEEQDVTD